MNRKILLSLLMLMCVAVVKAQWTARDSLWLQDVLSGKDSLRLNPETMHLIREGGLINLEAPLSPMGAAPAELPIVKDFSEYLELPDTVHRKLPLTALPSDWVLRYYNPEIPDKYKMNDHFFDFMSRVRREASRPTGYDFAHGLNMLFSKQYRQHQKNSEKAKNLKFYRDLPSDEMNRKMIHYRLDHPEKVIVQKDGERLTKPDLPLPLVTSRIKRDSITTNQSSSAPDSIAVAIPADSLWSKIPRE